MVDYVRAVRVASFIRSSMCLFSSVLLHRIVFPARYNAFLWISNNCGRIEINRDRSGCSPKNEGTLTGFIPNGQKMFQNSIGASISGLVCFRAFSHPRKLYIMGNTRRYFFCNLARFRKGIPSSPVDQSI